MRLAIVDPHPLAGEVLALAARRRGHQVICLADEQRLLGWLPFQPAVIVLSPAQRGDEALRAVGRVRDRFPEQLLVVTVEGPSARFATAILEAGADDVVRVPYHPTELLLKFEAARRRLKESEQSAALQHGDLMVDLDRFVAAKAGKPLRLTKLERRLLHCLCAHSPHLAPLERLLDFGWDGRGEPDPSLLKTHISHLRRKLREAGGLPVEISSRHTLGYALSFPDEVARPSPTAARVLPPTG